MGTTPWWIWLLTVSLLAPWVVAIVVVWKRTPPRDEEWPSLGEVLRRHYLSGS